MMMTIGKHRIGWRHVALGLAALLLPATVHADVIVPHSFVPGTKIVAAEVNANFSALADAIDTKQNKIVGSCDPGSAVVHVNDDGSLLCMPTMAAPPAPLVGSSKAFVSLLSAGSNHSFPPSATIVPTTDVTCMVNVNAGINAQAIATGIARLFPVAQLDGGASALFEGGIGAAFPGIGGSDNYVTASNTGTIAVPAGTSAKLGCGIESVTGDYVGRFTNCWVSWFCH